MDKKTHKKIHMVSVVLTAVLLLFSALPAVSFADGGDDKTALETVRLGYFDFQN